MSDLQNKNTVVFICDCGLVSHAISFTKLDDEPELYISVSLPRDSLLKRIRRAIMHIFNRDNYYGEIAEVVLMTDEIERLAEYMDAIRSPTVQLVYPDDGTVRIKGAIGVS